MPKEILGEKLYTLKEVAAILSVTPRTVQTYLKDKRILAQRIGRKWLFTEDNVRAFVQARQPFNLPQK